MPGVWKLPGSQAVRDGVTVGRRRLRTAGRGIDTRSSFCPRLGWRALPCTRGWEAPGKGRSLGPRVALGRRRPGVSEYGLGLGVTCCYCGRVCWLSGENCSSQGPAELWVMGAVPAGAELYHPSFSRAGKSHPAWSWVQEQAGPCPAVGKLLGTCADKCRPGD